MKKVVLVIILIFFVFIVQNLSHSIYGLLQKKELLVKARNDLAKAKQDNQTLKNQASAVKQPYFIEEQARDKLLMTKPGEQIVVAPDKLIVKDVRSAVVKKEKTNWQLWWALFFP